MPARAEAPTRRLGEAVLASCEPERCQGRCARFVPSNQIKQLARRPRPRVNHVDSHFDRDRGPQDAATPQLKDDPPEDGRHHRLMAKKAITVTVSRPGFIATETFMSTTDAQAWKDMVETTLEHIDKIHLLLGDLRSLTSPRPFAPTAARTPRTNGSR